MSTAFDAVVGGNGGVDTNVYLHGAEIDWTREANEATSNTEI